MMKMNETIEMNDAVAIIEKMHQRRFRVTDADTMSIVLDSISQTETIDFLNNDVFPGANLTINILDRFASRVIGRWLNVYKG